MARTTTRATSAPTPVRPHAAGYVLTDYDYDVTCLRNVPGFGWAGLKPDRRAVPGSRHVLRGGYGP